MAFFLIVPSVMIVSIMLLHTLAKRLRLKIYYSILIAVALMSFAVIFAAVNLSPVPDKNFLIYLGSLILSTSLILTLTNNFLIKRQRNEEKIFTEKVKAAYEEEIKKDSAKPIVEEIVKPIDKLEVAEEKSDSTIETTSEEESMKEITETETSEKIIEPVDNPKPLENFPLEEVFKPLDKVKSEAIAKSLENENTPPLEETKSEENFPLQEVFKPLDKINSKALEKIDKDAKSLEEPAPEENFPLQETFKPLNKVKPEILQKIQQDIKPLKLSESEELQIEEKISEPIEESQVEEKISEPIEESQVEEKISEPIEESQAEEKNETLDDILDKAYDERAKGHVWQAIEHYRKALERYSNDEYAPFVAIDLGNLYKENALYSKAIKIYEEALNLPTVKRNAETKKEFITNLEYLRVVRDILLKHKALSTPFGKISKAILQEIDTEFQKTQNLSS